MPTTAEFIEISERIQVEKAKENRINQEIAESNRYIEHNYEGKEKVAEMVAKIGSDIGKKQANPPQITIYEYFDQSGNCSYKSMGKIDFEIFGNEVYKFCGQRPKKIRHTFQRFETFKKKYANDEIRTYSTFVEKNSAEFDTQIFTVGYL